MIIDTSTDLSAVNERFNRFHDGFIKRLVVTSCNEFLSHMPWEENRSFESNEDELDNTGLCLFDHDKRIELEIHHYNYDWPNQPRRRAILIHASPVSFCERLISFVGAEIFDLSFGAKDDVVSCSLVYHTEDAGPVRKIENGVAVTLFLAPKIEIMETEWTEQSDER